MKSRNRFGFYLAMAMLVATSLAHADKPVPADVVVMDAKIYAEDAQHRTVQALAVQAARSFTREQTQE